MLPEAKSSDIEGSNNNRIIKLQKRLRRLFPDSTTSATQKDWIVSREEAVTTAQNTDTGGGSRDTTIIEFTDHNGQADSGALVRLTRNRYVNDDFIGRVIKELSSSPEQGFAAGELILTRDPLTNKSHLSKVRDTRVIGELEYEIDKLSGVHH